MGKLYCVCNKASKEVCAKCEKGKCLKPDQVFYCSTWRKK